MSDKITVIPFKTMEGCAQIEQGDPGRLVMCRDCTDQLCRKVRDNVRILSTRHLTFNDVLVASR